MPSYTKEFPPNQGDRVFANFNYRGLLPGRIVAYDDEYITIKSTPESFMDGSYYQRFKWDQVTFRKPCPWYKFWQRKR